MSCLCLYGCEQWHQSDRRFFVAVDEQDGTDLRWVKIDLYRDLYEYNPPELFGVLASLRIASVSNDKSTLVNICAYKKQK